MALNPAFADASINPSQSMGNDASVNPTQGALPTANQPQYTSPLNQPSPFPDTSQNAYQIFTGQQSESGNAVPSYQDWSNGQMNQFVTEQSQLGNSPYAPGGGMNINYVHPKEPLVPMIPNFNQSYYQSPQYQSYQNNLNTTAATDDYVMMPFGGYGSGNIANLQNQSYEDFLKNPSMAQQPNIQEEFGVPPTSMPQYSSPRPTNFMDPTQLKSLGFNQSAYDADQAFNRANPSYYGDYKPTDPMAAYFPDQNAYNAFKQYNKTGDTSSINSYTDFIKSGQTPLGLTNSQRRLGGDPNEISSYTSPTQLDLPTQQPGPTSPLAPMRQDYTNPSDFEGLTFATSMDGLQNAPIFEYGPGATREDKLRSMAPYMTRENYANNLNRLRRPADSILGSTGGVQQPVQQPQGIPRESFFTGPNAGQVPQGYQMVNGELVKMGLADVTGFNSTPFPLAPQQPTTPATATPTGTTPMATNPLSQLPVTPSAAYTPAPVVGTASSGGGSFTQGAPLPNITTTQQQVTAAPAFYTDYLNQLAKQGASTAQNAQYVGATDLQNQAFDRTSQNVGNYQPALQSAINMAQNVGNSNLYEAIGNLGQANIARNLAPQATAGIVGSGQFGSKRGAAALGDTIANAELGITAQQATALQQDMQNRIAAAQQLGNLASTTQQLGLGDINALATMGGQKQTIAQNEQLFPMQQLTNQSQLLRGYTIPTSTGSSYTGPIPGAYAASPLQQIAGLGALGAGISTTPLGSALFGTSPTIDPKTGLVINPGTSGIIGKGVDALTGGAKDLFSYLNPTGPADLNGDTSVPVVPPPGSAINSDGNYEYDPNEYSSLY